MISHRLYQPLYLLVVTILTLALAVNYPSRTDDSELKSARSLPIGAIALTLAVILFIGFRPMTGFGDTVNYVANFNFAKSHKLLQTWDWNVPNILFTNIFGQFARYFDTPAEFFVFIAAIYFGGIFLACRRIFRGNTLATLVVCLGAFSTFSYGTNGIKAGAAASIFLVALSCYNKRWIMVVIALASYGFHHSMQLCLGTLIVVILYRNPMFYLWVWGVCFVIAALHITSFQEFFAGITDESGIQYLGTEWVQEDKGWAGFRIDFIAYSFVPIAVGIYALFVKKIKSNYYNFLLCIYLVTNAIWLLCIYALFTNRIAYLSWCMLPIVLVYPILHPQWGENRFRTFAVVMTLHLAFTIFMQFR